MAMTEQKKSEEWVEIIYIYTRSLGYSAPHLLAPVEGWGALQAPMGLWAILEALGPLFCSRRRQTKHDPIMIL